MFAELRQAGKTDIPSIVRVENVSFPDPWPSDLFEECVRPALGVRTWLALNGGRLVGYVCAALPVEGILHIANLCVIRSWRRRGIARSLLDVVEGWGMRLGARHSYLEVRSGNRAALALYAGRGYSPCEFLSDYYGSGRSGFRLVRKLPASASSTARAELGAAIHAGLGGIPPVGVVLGSGLSWMGDILPARQVVEMDSLPGAGAPGVEGHPGLLKRSRCGRFVFVVGRRHHYQGYGGDEISLIPSVLADLGTRTWLLTSSAGGLAPGLEAGDVLAMEDSVNLSGCIPSGGGRCGGSLFSPELLRIASACAARTRSPFRKGIFACVSGPAYETPAEMLLLRRLGADAVSMSTVPEALALSSAGCDVLGLAFISNVASPGNNLTHEEVLAASATAERKQKSFIRALLGRLAEHELH